MDKERTIRFLAVSAAGARNVGCAAEKASVTTRTIYLWMKRFAERGRELREKSRRPHHVRTIDLEKRRRSTIICISLRRGCEKIAFEEGCSSSMVHSIPEVLQRGETASPSTAAKADGRLPSSI